MPTAAADGLAAQLGPERLAQVFPMKSLEASGGRFVLASDGPLFWQTPLEAMESAVTRQKPGGSEAVMAPGEAIELRSAIRAYTINGAYLMGHDDRVGSIDEGKYADMLVLDRNPFEVLATEIGSTRVLQTVFNGEVVYDTAIDSTGEEAIEAKYDVDLDLSGNQGDSQYQIPDG